MISFFANENIFAKNLLFYLFLNKKTLKNYDRL